ncbi:hypothetical protein IWW38_003274, partial [Coemansia aciculifera]
VDARRFQDEYVEEVGRSTKELVEVGDTRSLPHGESRPHHCADELGVHGYMRAGVSPRVEKI